MDTSGSGMSRSKSAIRVIGVLLLAMTVWTAHASAQNILNGNFTTLGSQTTSNSQVTTSATLPDWTLTGGNSSFYDCVTINPNSGGQFSMTTVTPMCGTGYASGGTNPAYSYGSLTQAIPALPVSYTGNVFIADAYSADAEGIAQTVTGLVSGASYSLTFYYTGAQQSGFSGTSTDEWNVSYGATSASTTTTSTPGITIPPTSGPVWAKETISFTTTSASEYINFLAGGNSTGNEPPFMLLADVNLTQNAVPEPASLAVLGAGLVGLIGFRRRRVRRSA